MKMEFWLLILVLCHATNSIESVNSPRNNVKLYKIFDEIFGEGWGDEEKPKLSESNESQSMEASSTENRYNSNHNEQNESEKSWDRNDRSEIDLNDNIQSNQVPVELVDSNLRHVLINKKPCSEGHKKVKCYSEDQKSEIVQEYIKLKRQYRQKGKVSKNEWYKFNVNTAKNLAVHYHTICMWQKQFVPDKTWHSDEQKQQKLKEYYEIKLRNPKTIDTDIAADLGIPIRKLKYWKSQFNHTPELNMPVPSTTKCYSDDQKREFVQEYIELKNKFMQEKKHSQNEWRQFKANMSKELGVSHATISTWKKQFFGDNIKKYTDEEKLKKLKEYYEIKLRNPKTIDTDIAADLEITIRTLRYWKAQFKHSPELNMPVPKCYSDDRKREIVQEFIELKNKFMQEKKHSQNEWRQFKANMSKELGVSHATISTWKKQFFGDNIKKCTDKQKQEKMKEYYEIKLRNPKIKDADIAADLKITIRTLRYWKAQFKHSPELNMPVPKCYSDDRKREIVQEFIELKNKFMQEKKHSQNEWKQFYANIFKELDVSHATILKWKKQLELE